MEDADETRERKGTSEQGSETSIDIIHINSNEILFKLMKTLKLRQLLTSFRYSGLHSYSVILNFQFLIRT